MTNNSRQADHNIIELQIEENGELVTYKYDDRKYAYLVTKKDNENYEVCSVLQYGFTDEQTLDSFVVLTDCYHGGTFKTTKTIKNGEPYIEINIPNAKLMTNIQYLAFSKYTPSQKIRHIQNCKECAFYSRQNEAFIRGDISMRNPKRVELAKLEEERSFLLDSDENIL